MPLEIICYHCQQASEKYLKGFLCYHGKNIPKSHDVGALCQLCKEIDLTFRQIEAESAELTFYATSTLYPSNAEILESDMKLALEYAQRIGNFVRSKLEAVKKESSQ